MDGIKWEKYLQDIQQIYEISNELSDDWEIIQKVIFKFFNFNPILAKLNLVFNS